MLKLFPGYQLWSSSYTAVSTETHLHVASSTVNFEAVSSAVLRFQ